MLLKSLIGCCCTGNISTAPSNRAFFMTKINIKLLNKQLIVGQEVGCFFSVLITDWKPKSPETSVHRKVGVLMPDAI
jgi:hypothetical protein